MNKLFVLFFILIFTSLTANADMLDPASPLSLTNPFNPISPYNRSNPVSPYYIGRDDEENDSTRPCNCRRKIAVISSKKAITVISGKEEDVRKIKSYSNCVKYEGGKACINILK